MPSLGSVTHGPDDPRLWLLKCEGASWGVGGDPSSGCASMIGAAGKSVHELHGRLSALQSVVPTPSSPPLLEVKEPLSSPPTPNISPAPGPGPEVCPVFAHDTSPVTPANSATATDAASITNVRQALEFTTPRLVVRVRCGRLTNRRGEA